MNVMILAAGFGRRMLPLTQSTAKPLLKVGQHALIEHLLIALSQQHFKNVVINVHHFADQVMHTLGDGSRYNLNIQYSIEEPTVLGTGGGIAKALPLLGDEPFLLISGDIFTDFNFSSLNTLTDQLGHLVLIPNPDFHPQGDFSLSHNQLIEPGPQYTYANIAVLSPQLFQYRPQHTPVFALAPLFQRAIESHQLSGELFLGPWHNVGSPVLLKNINHNLTLTS